MFAHERFRVVGSSLFQRNFCFRGIERRQCRSRVPEQPAPLRPL
jgi:hypothetical protein